MPPNLTPNSKRAIRRVCTLYNITGWSRSLTCTMMTNSTTTMATDSPQSICDIPIALHDLTNNECWSHWLVEMLKCKVYHVLTSSQRGAWAPGCETGTSRVGIVKSTRVKPPPDWKNKKIKEGSSSVIYVITCTIDTISMHVRRILFSSPPKLCCIDCFVTKLPSGQLVLKFITTTTTTG